MKNPEITVVTTLYNGADYIKQTIDSVLNQTFEDFEYIIIDDMSTDDSVKLVKSYKDPRIRLIQNKENMGTYKSANVGIKEAKGKYIARIDSDDVATPSRFERQLKFLKENSEYKLVGSFGITIDEIGNFLAPRPYPIEFHEITAEMFFGCSFMHSTVMFEKDFAEKVGFYTEDERKSMDYDFYFKMMKAGAKVYNIPEMLVQYRIHPNSITSTQFSGQESIGHKVLQKNLNEFLNLDVSIEEVQHLRKALVGDMEYLNKSRKMEVLKYLRKFKHKINKEYPERPRVKEHALYMCFYTVDKMLSNTLLRKIAKLYVRLP